MGGGYLYLIKGVELTVAAILYRCFCVQGIKSGEYRCFQDATGGKATTCRFWVVALLEHWQCLGLVVTDAGLRCLDIRLW